MSLATQEGQRGSSRHGSRWEMRRSRALVAERRDSSLPSTRSAVKPLGKRSRSSACSPPVALDVCAGMALDGLVSPSLCVPTTPRDCVSRRLAKIESDHGADPPC